MDSFNSRSGPRAAGSGGPDPLEQRLDRWVSAGRQFVDGVAGARPGSRPQGRGSDRRAGRRPSLDGLGRWVEDRLDWLLEDGDDWREPWEEQRPATAAPSRGSAQGSLSTSTPTPTPAESRNRPRRSLEAISRRGGAPARDAEPAAAADAWPEDDTFSVNRWQRGASPRREVPPAPVDPRSLGSGPEASGGRPLPRSTRRR
ncbi:MAG: hypothetical protein ACK55H_06910 [Cyanobacteriota bacterium]|jgi:hypothetical protein